LKLLFFVIIFVSVLFLPSAFGQISDKTGLVNRLPIETGGYNFEVVVTASFDIPRYEFNSDEKRLTIFITTTVKNNLGEFQIPINLINGNFTFYLDDEEVFPVVLSNEKISFITIEFPGNGLHKLDIIGTTYLPEFSEIAPLVLATSMLGVLFLKRIRNKVIR